MGNNTKVVFHTTDEQEFAHIIREKFLPLLESEEYCQAHSHCDAGFVWMFDLRKANTDKLEKALMVLSQGYFKYELITVSDHYNPDQSYTLVRGKLVRLNDT
jgi:hypothetical protein